MLRSFFMALAVAGAMGLATAAEARVSIMPNPRPPGQWVWVEPVYRTEYIRVWVPDRIQQVADQYWVSATYGWRTVICYDEYGRRIERREWGEIVPGHYETTYRQVVVGGHYETQSRQVLVSDGYWQRVVPVPPPYVEPPIVIQPMNPPTVKVDGSTPEWEADKGKFSPLYEWPK